MGYILVIDDDCDVRTLLRKILKKAGYNVKDAPNGAVGIKLYNEEPADLVITDLVMPVKDGMETIKELRKCCPDIKVIAISGGECGGSLENLSVARSLGAACALNKPLNMDKLLRQIRELLA